MRKRTLITLLLLLTVSAVSCLSAPSVSIGKDTEQTIGPREPLQGDAVEASLPKAIFHQGFIEIQVLQDPGFNVGKIYTSVYNERLYLNPLYISSGGGHVQSFQIDYPKPFSFENPPRQILWITSHGYNQFTSFPWNTDAKSITAYPLPTSISEESIEAP